MKNTLGTHSSVVYPDSILGVPYEQVKVNAQALSQYLKANLEDSGIDYKKYNTQTREEKEAGKYRSQSEQAQDKLESAPPIEIYEYQNFFLLKMVDDSLVLLDGFRRLLWYNPPNIDITVRIYKESDLKNTDILTLLVNLNHFKFYGGGGSYYDRGFALLLKTIFNLNIPKYTRAFDAYLHKNNIKNDYSSEWSDGTANETVKQRIINEHFVSDIKFLEDLVDSNVAMVNEFVGALVYQFRIKYPNLIFDAQTFLKLQSQNVVIVGLMDKFRKAGTNDSAKSREAVNQIMEIYENILMVMAGGKVEKSYAELTQECKEMSDGLKSDKNWTKLTGNTLIYTIETLMEKKINNNIPMEFKCIVFPNDSKTVISIPCGLRDDVEFIKFTPKHGAWQGEQEMNFGFKEKDSLFTIRHNHGNYYHSYGKKYTKATAGSLPQSSYDIDLYINISKSEVKAAEEARFSNRNE